MNWQGINKGDTVFIQSDVTHTLMKHKCTIKDILESFRESVGPEGTLLFPAFSRNDFTKTTFDIRTTPSDCGVLSEYARTYPGAVRSGHPMFSFVAIGYDAELFNVDNFIGYGKDSPFEIPHRMNGKIAILGLPNSRGNSFFHYIEEVHQVPYRFYKNFTGLYTDWDGKTEERTYSFYCRDRDAGVVTLLDPVDDLMWKAGLYTGFRPLEGNGLRVIETKKMFDFVSDIITSGGAEGLLWEKKK